jgi:hypothetical protein
LPTFGRRGHGRHPWIELDFNLVTSSTEGQARFFGQCSGPEDGGRGGCLTAVLGLELAAIVIVSELIPKRFAP